MIMSSTDLPIKHERIFDELPTARLRTRDSVGSGHVAIPVGR
jgi:hypothetical protein